jgi:hypothetical protein
LIEEGVQMTLDVDELINLNKEMALRENAGDSDWFENILAPEIAFRRASGVIIDREAFLSALKNPSNTLRTYEQTEGVEIAENLAVFKCIISTTSPSDNNSGNTGPADDVIKKFRNIRLFVKQKFEDDSRWLLLGWANEDITSK